MEQSYEGKEASIQLFDTRSNMPLNEITSSLFVDLWQNYKNNGYQHSTWISFCISFVIMVHVSWLLNSYKKTDSPNIIHIYYLFVLHSIKTKDSHNHMKINLQHTYILLWFIDYSHVHVVTKLISSLFTY